MEKIPELAVLVLTLLGFVAWLGGGRKWAFRTMLAVLALTFLGVVGTFLYVFGTETVAEHRAQKIHQCAIAKVANARCTDLPKSAALPNGAIECPAFFLFDDATSEQEQSAFASAEKECTSAVDPTQESLHEQIIRYKREHDIKPETSQVNSEKVLKIRLNDKDCATKVRTFYPHAYDDLSDSVLTK